MQRTKKPGNFWKTKLFVKQQSQQKRKLILTEEIQSITTATTTLPVMESFYTLQGEGYHAGKAAYFIRLGGCNVGCVWCDVKESWDANTHPQYSIEEIVKGAADYVRQTTDNRRQRMVEQAAGSAIIHSSSVVRGLLSTSTRPSSSGIVVVTGGEPLMHNLDELTTALHHAGFQTNIETSGSSTLSGHWDWICLSPKKFKAPLPEILPQADELKVVVFNKSDFGWAEQHAAHTSPGCKLYLQAEWSRRYQMMPLIVDYIKANPQWQLSLQVHKYIDVP